MSSENQQQHSSLSRRAVIGGAGVLASGAAIGSVFRPDTASASEVASPAAPGKKTPGAPVLALIGDRYHNLDYIRTHLIKFFGSINVKFDYTANWEWFTTQQDTASMLDGYKIFLTFRDGYTFPDGYIGPDAYPNISGYMDNPPNGAEESWVTEGYGQAVKNWVSGGGSLFAAHNSAYQALYSQNFRDVLHGVADGHPYERPFKMNIVDSNHPVTKGANSFILADEQHFPIYDGGSTVLMEGVNTDGLGFTTMTGRTPSTSVAGWTHTFGSGKVVHQTVGHNLDALWKPDNLTIWKNTISWLLS